MQGDSASARRIAAAAVASIALSSDLAAAAENPPPPPPPDGAAIYQYRESLPAAGGPVVPGVEGTTPRSLPPRVSVALGAKGGSDTAVLKEIATSPALGAPIAQRDLPPLRDVAGVAEPSLAGATGRAITGDAGARLAALLAFMVVAALGAAAVARRRPTPR